eukprot:11558348-Alexandrium_andersonii.AAC.1
MGDSAVFKAARKVATAHAAAKPIVAALPVDAGPQQQAAQLDVEQHGRGRGRGRGRGKAKAKAKAAPQPTICDAHI